MYIVFKKKKFSKKNCDVLPSEIYFSPGTELIPLSPYLRGGLYKWWGNEVDTLPSDRVWKTDPRPTGLLSQLKPQVKNLLSL